MLHVTDRDGVCRGVSSRWEGRKELRKKRDDSLETALVPLGLLVRWGLGGIWRNHAAESMLWGVVDSFQEGPGVGFEGPSRDL